MRTIIICVNAATILLFFTCHSLQAQVTDSLTRDPYDAPLVLDDLNNFIRAFETLTGESDTTTVLQAAYLDKGTPGLKMFIEKYNLTAEMLLGAIREHTEKYASLGEMPGLIEKQIPSIRMTFAELKNYIPDIVFPPTYFLVESYRGIGSGSIAGQLISVDKWVQPIDDKKTMIIHELVHFQQVVAVGYDKYKALFGPEKSLLGLCIREGTAEFFALLVTGRITQDEALDFTLESEKKLWEKFRQEMHGNQTGDWMWSKPEDPEQPPHVGYVVGYRIVEAYYNNAEDKVQAVRDILSVTDYPRFLEQSGYAEHFEL